MSDDLISECQVAHIKDSGARTEFSTGAVRDIQEGKGRCDLLPLCELGAIFSDDILTHVGLFMCSHGEDKFELSEAFRLFCSDRWASVAHGVCADANSDDRVMDAPAWYEGTLELAKHFEEGAKKYGEYNWQKGIPVSRYIDSATRHYLKYRAGWTDEPHDRAFIWNILCCLWTLTNKPELNDLK